MRRLFFATFLIAACISFYRSNVIDDLYYSMETEGTVFDWFFSLADAAEDRAMRRFKANAQPIFVGLQPHQVEYAGQVMKNKKTLRAFYGLYCEKDDKNPYIYGQTLTEFCNQISTDKILSQ